MGVCIPCFDVLNGAMKNVGADGLLDTVLEGPFRLTVPSGVPTGNSLQVTVQARDVVGFRSQRDTFVTVGP